MIKVKKILGQISETLPNIQFKVQLFTGERIRCYLSGRMNLNKIKLIPGDIVEIEVPAEIADGKIENYVGRIVFRQKNVNKRLVFQESR